MSFSSDVKNELFKMHEKNRHCNIAELSAIINMNASFINERKKLLIKVQTESYIVAKKCFFLLKNIFNINSDVIVRKNNSIKKNMTYIILISEYDSSKKILKTIGLIDENEMLIKKNINHLIVSSICCKRAYIRGAFICVGSLCNPEKTYHMEFVDTNKHHALQLRDIINSFNIDSKVIERKNHFIVYIKEGEQIVDILNIISAHKSLMKLENVRILKDVRNNVNRIVNCETANLGKVISASVKQREDIKYIQKIVGLNHLSKQLQEAANIRLKYPDLSLRELGEMLVPPVGKSGVNHRLKKISSIAEKLREDLL